MKKKRRSRKKKSSTYYSRFQAYYESDQFDEHLDMIIENLKDWGVPGSKIDRFMSMKTRSQKFTYLASVVGINAALVLLPAGYITKVSKFTSTFA